MLIPRYTYISTIMLLFCVSCGGGGDFPEMSDSDEGTAGAEGFETGDSGEIAQTGEDDVEDVETESGDLAQVKYVTLANPDLPASLRTRYAANTDDAVGEPAPGCKSVEYVYDITWPRTYCFKKVSKAPHYMTLRDSTGKEVFTMYAGANCRRVDIKAGRYEMEICREGGEDAEEATTIFVADRDVSATDASDIPDGEIADGDDGSEYDYEDDGEDVGEWEALVTPRFLDSSDNTTFLTTNSCIRCDLSGADFSGIDFTLVAPGFATLTGSDLTSADLTGADLTGSTMNKVKLDSADLANAVLTNVNLTSASLKDADLTAAVLAGANLTRARLDDATLSTANLAAANLTRARFNGALLDGANLNAAAMTYVVLEYADLTGAVLTGGANLSYAKAGAADFTNADLTAANLTSAYFNGATFTSADLLTVNLRKARFNSADLTSVDLTGATNATQAVWKSTILTSATWTDGTACSVPPSESNYDPSTSKCN